jgi:hypothetical protein
MPHNALPKTTRNSIEGVVRFVLRALAACCGGEIRPGDRLHWDGRMKLARRLPAQARIADELRPGDRLVWRDREPVLIRTLTVDTGALLAADLDGAFALIHPPPDPAVPSLEGQALLRFFAP